MSPLNSAEKTLSSSRAAIFFKLGPHRRSVPAGPLVPEFLGRPEQQAGSAPERVALAHKDA